MTALTPAGQKLADALVEAVLISRREVAERPGPLNTAATTLALDAKPASEITEGLREARTQQLQAAFEASCAEVITKFASGADFNAATMALAQFALDNRSLIHAALARPDHREQASAGLGDATPKDPGRALKEALFACLNAGDEFRQYGGEFMSDGRKAWVRFTAETPEVSAILASQPHSRPVGALTQPNQPPEAAAPSGSVGDVLSYETDKDGAWTWLVWAISPAGAHLAAIAHTETKAERYRASTERLYPGARVHIERAPVDHSFGGSDLRSVAYRAAMKDARRQDRAALAQQPAPQAPVADAAGLERLLTRIEEGIRGGNAHGSTADMLRAIATQGQGPLPDTMEVGHILERVAFLDWASEALASLRAALTPPQAARPTPERVRHVKRGTEYEVLGEAEAQVSYNHRGWPAAFREASDGSKLTVYRALASGKLWCRFTDEFRDGRFETLPAPERPDAAEGRS